MRKSYESQRSQLSAWEEGCFDRSTVLWDMLMSGTRERDFGKKVAALDGLLGQLSAWKELLEKGGKA